MNRVTGGNMVEIPQLGLKSKKKNILKRYYTQKKNQVFRA